MNAELDETSSNTKSDSESHCSPESSKYDESLSTISTIAKPLTSLNPIDNTFFIEVIKSGIVLSKKYINKSVITFGRSRECDFALDHPSISRYHCVLLWKEDPVDLNKLGFFYLLDLNSTHGTFLNKQKLNHNKLVKIVPRNNIFKLGGSSRVFMLNSIVDEQYVADDDKPTEKKNNVETYCSWGILDETTDENEDNDVIAPLASILSLLQTDYTSTPTVNDNVYRENPQKALQQWFEREGYEYQYKIDCLNGKFKCTFELPIDGQDVVVEGKLFLKKKESIIDACLRCCQLLDKANIFFPWQIQKTQDKARCSSDSEDEIIDETGEIEKKRSKKEASQTVNTFETLTEKWNNLSSELQSLKAKLAAMNVINSNLQKKTNDESDDALDSFMCSLNANDSVMSSTIDSKIQKSKLRVKISELEKSQRRIERLLKLSKPSKYLDEIKPTSGEHNTIIPQGNEVSKKVIKAKIDSAINRRTIGSFTSVDNKNNEIQEKEGKFNVEKTSKVFSEEEECFVKPRDILPSKGRQKPMLEVKQCKKHKTDTQTYAQKEAYVDWVPPATQTGDGRTSLNDKYGY